MTSPRHRSLFALALAVSAASVVICTAQTETPATQSRMRVAMVESNPFVAASMTVLKRKLADGTQVQASSTDIIARDSAGRWYSDQHPVTGRQQSPNVPYRPDVRDPLERRFMHFVPPTRTVLLYPLAVVSDQPKQPPQTTVEVHGNVTVKTEPLPEQTILGYAAWGQRTTVTAMRAGKPSVAIDEVWYSNQLGMDLIRRHTDAITGEEVTAIMDLKRQEPDPALFEIPSGWTREDLGSN
jgi:hypothetical protein